MDLRKHIEARWNTRTKPQGSLGRLEDAARDYCLIRGEVLPRLERLGLYLFAADHGVTAEGISLYPSEVTRQMMANFNSGGAAVNVLARAHDIEVHVVDAGVGNGTRNFAREEAMSAALFEDHIERGRAHAREAVKRYDLVGLGEMGIGNTTSASAIVAALLNVSGSVVAGRGTGLDEAGVAHKAEVIERTLDLHGLREAGAARVLLCVGGFEIVEMVGFLREASRLRLAVMMDGFITGAAALAAAHLEPTCRETMMFSHTSAERAHGDVLDALGAQPLLDLSMRLGEGSGAILGMHLVRCAMLLYTEMASFESANVSGKNL